MHVPWNSPCAAELLGVIMAPYVYRGMSVACIGSTSCPGDSLGPRVGTILADNNLGVSVRGTLDNPINAANINEYLFPNPYLAVDACLGESVGYIIFTPQPLLPGAALNKNLPPIGNVQLMAVLGHYYHDLFTISQQLLDEVAAIMASAIWYALAIRDHIDIEEIAI